MMVLTLKEAKELYTLLYFETIDGKEFIMDKLEEYICEEEPDFDFHTYLLSLGWKVGESKEIKNIEEYFRLQRLEKALSIVGDEIKVLKDLAFAK